MSRISRKARDVPPFYVMEMLERAQELIRAGHDIVRMEVGEPDFDTPEPIVEVGARAMRGGDTHYTHSMGTVALREAIAARHLRDYGTPVDPACVVVTSGSSPALLITFMALCDAGDEVIISNPHYACYPNMITFAGGTPVRVDVDERDGFAYRPESIAAAITPRTKAILINSPANPTGNVLPDDTFRALADSGVLVISDEIYHGLVYEGRARSMREFTEDCVVVNGFSKLFAMTGWRLGYIIAPPDLVRPLQKIQQNFFISAGSFAQAAALAALAECAEPVEAMRAEYARRRTLVLSRLRAMGRALVVEPTGAFYAFVNVADICRRTGRNTRELAVHILETAHVAVTPGTDFGPGGEGFIRLSYASRYERLEEGLGRLERYFATV